MNIKKYILSNIPYLIMNFIIFLFAIVLFKIVNMPNVIIFCIFLIWFMPLLVYIVIQFFKEKRFYGEIQNINSKLDKKYFLSEVIKKPNYYQGKIFYEILKDANRNMHEEVNYYKHLQSDYAEYIEVWVHEIKTPIASCKMILENSNSRDKNALIDEINKIDRYINQALYYSRSTDFNKDYIIKTFNLQKVINECIRENRREFINKRIGVQIDSNTDIEVISDAKWIRFIINQILINSIKYSKDENAEIKIYTIQYMDSQEVSLVIEDNGIGIPKSDINRVFDKGFTGENGRIYGKSTGIGLYLCKNLCKKLDLDLILMSEVNVGTRIFIKFVN